MHTPWGTSDSSHQYTRGITFYSTPRHGGFRVSPTMLEKMPEAIRRIPVFCGKEGWYEEDCDANLVVLAFPIYFDPQMVKGAVRAAESHFKESLDLERYLNEDPTGQVVKRIAEAVA